jgi:hypothetical protein
MTGPAPTADWARYLDTLDAVADALDAALTAAAGVPADGPAQTWVPTLPEVAVPMPAGPPPAGSQDRREALLARLVVLTGRLERRLDDVAHELARLPARRPRQAERYAGALGEHLDLQS